MKRFSLFIPILISVVTISFFIGYILSPFITAPHPSKEELHQYALTLVNEDRKSHGVPPVLLGNDLSAQAHADDMLNAKYYSHWNTEGVKPYVTYAKLGGKGSVAENIAGSNSYCILSFCVPPYWDPYKIINQTEYVMMYDDAASEWGHRDNIIYPDHTHVSFGVAYDTQRIRFVQHFENNIIKWQATTLRATQLHLVGQMPAGYSLSHIVVYQDPDPKILTAYELDNTTPYHHVPPHYDSGQLVGMILAPLADGRHYQECSTGKTTFEYKSGEKKCVDYTTYNKKNSNSEWIDITADVSKWNGPGLHTIYLFLKKPTDEYVTATSITLEYLR